MNFKNPKTGSLFAFFAILGCINLWAANDVPCIVFSGKAGTEERIDLSVYTRIYFNDNSFTVRSMTDPKSHDIELLYSLFNHIEFKNAIPTGIEDIAVDTESSLSYIVDSKALLLKTSTDSQFTIGIFNISGNLEATARLTNGQTLSLEELPSGVYVAIATDTHNQLTLKFIVK